jgi:large subunit ribosomal protein L24
MKRIKTNDNVVVISGRDKGKTGVVLEISQKKGAVKVKDVMMVFKHQKPRGMGGAVGGIKHKEAWILESKVMPLCSHCNKASRVQTKVLEAGVSSRICGRCKEVF